QAAAGRAEIEVVLESSPVRFLQRPGYETTSLPFGSDAPYLEGFGGRMMIGPGEPEDAHTAEEKVEKRALIEAAEIYRRLVRDLDGETAGR
ncbi:MAG TPA: M20/M25/M40 family metallo-hydrolase, partial [Candidatus Aminicenantes bacterium]|nr:M20/M25/M40 family metallo-hydrolase [Candidatus Aminicenantes bacterium]